MLVDQYPKKEFFASNTDTVCTVATALCDIVHIFDAFEFSRVERECSVLSPANSTSSSPSSVVATGEGATASSDTPSGLSVGALAVILLAGVVLGVGVFLGIRHRRRKDRQPAPATAERDDEESLL